MHADKVKNMFGITNWDDPDALLHEGVCTMAFQPILDFRTQKTYGFEALLRGFSGTPLSDPEALFCRAADQDDEEVLRLDMACIGSALRAGRELAKSHHLFININSFTLLRLSTNLGSLLQLLDELQIDANNIIFEISERTDLSCISEVEKHLIEFMKLGIQVAIDDIGASFNWLHHMLNTKPAFLKVDKAFIHNIDVSRRKQALVKSLNLMSDSMGVRLIAEGVETLRQTQLLGEMGVAFAQGYWFGRPQPAEDWLQK